MNSPVLRQQIEALFYRFNEPVIPAERIRRWLDRFPKNDLPGAIALLRTIEFHSYPRLVRECRTLNAGLQKELTDDGFDSNGFTNVDFSREFTCKSGDIISYIFRKANAVPSTVFRNFECLSADSARCTGQFCDRALVILDDYTGTGSQFIFQFLVRNMDDIRVLKGYRKVYLASIVCHDNAFEKLELLHRGEFRKVLTIEESQFPDYDWDWEEKDLYARLGNMDWSRVRFICAEREHPLLFSDNTSVSTRERDLIGQFLSKYGGDSTLSTSYLYGRHAFFYGAPNSVPRVLLPLFSRVEDLTIYPTEHFIGDFPDIVCWDMDDTAE